MGCPVLSEPCVSDTLRVLIRALCIKCSVVSMYLRSPLKGNINLNRGFFYSYSYETVLIRFLILVNYTIGSIAPHVV